MQRERAEELLGIWKDYGLVLSEQIVIDNRVETRYTARKNPAVVPLLAFAAELAYRPNVFNFYRGSEEALL